MTVRETREEGDCVCMRHERVFERERRESVCEREKERVLV